ncbi:MAG: DUF4185 domain-containing protein [Clostridiales bacterium]|nr:DUF4185 domain-containing protein [Clostridiales bacterium]
MKKRWAKKLVCAILPLAFILPLVFSGCKPNPTPPTPPEPAKSQVVFVSSEGSTVNDGLTKESATTLSFALGMVKKDGGTIVITNPISLDESIDGKYFFPSNEKGITITSVYDGVDYRTTDNASILVSSVVSFYGDYTFNAVDFISGGTNAFLCFQYNNITIGEDVNCYRKAGVSNDIAIICGYSVASAFIYNTYETSCHEDAEIIVKSGTWQYIRGGNRRLSAEALFGTIDSGVTLVIKVAGGNFTSTATDLNSVVGMNSVDGTVYMEITGGNFEGGVYLLSRTGSNTNNYPANINGKVTLNIKGGTFKDCKFLVNQSKQAPTINTDDLTICLQGGTFINKIVATGVNSGATLMVSEDLTVDATLFSLALRTNEVLTAPTLNYVKTTFSAPPTPSKKPVQGNDIFDITEEEKNGLTDEAKEKLAKVQTLAQFDGKTDYLNDFRTLKDTKSNYNLNRVVSSRLVTLLTGEYSINKTLTNFGIGGAGGGYMIDCGDFTLIAFGDNEEEGGLGGPWRSNTLGFTTDFDYTDGITFDGFYENDTGKYDGIATEFLNSAHKEGVEKSKIPTGGIKIGNTLYFGFMSVRTWSDDEQEGTGAKWQCNYGGLAKSTDMGRTWETSNDLRWPEESNFAQLYPVASGDMVYIFGVPGGRNGACKLMRVHKDDIENMSAYEYLVGRDSNGNAIFEKGYSAMMSDYACVDKAVGGVGVIYNEYLGEWIMTYATSNAGDIKNASIVMRVAKTLDGVWSDPVVIMSQKTYGNVYEPRICQRYSLGGGKKIMLICSRWDVYNSLIFEVELEKK